MRNPDRIPQVLEEIEKLWRLHPDWRLGQLICNVASWSDPNTSPWDLEEDELLIAIRQHLSKVEAVTSH